jgi:hypothetical protein
MTVSPQDEDTKRLQQAIGICEQFLAKPDLASDIRKTWQRRLDSFNGPKPGKQMLFDVIANYVPESREALQRVREGRRAARVGRKRQPNLDRIFGRLKKGGRITKWELAYYRARCAENRLAPETERRLARYGIDLVSPPTEE